MPHKLLLADDSVTIQRVIELTFADEDVLVRAVGDGNKAIASIQSERPDIVLADVGMPERDGYEVAAFIKGNPQLAGIPVLLLTGAFEPIDETRARAVGCDGVLVKPFEPQMVINRVKDLLAGRRSGGLWGGKPASPESPRDVPRPMAPLETEESQPPAQAAAGGAASASLEEYFDRLDAAFASVEAATEARSAPHVPHATPTIQPSSTAASLSPLSTTASPAALSTDDLPGWDPDLMGDPQRPAVAAAAPVQPPPVEPPVVQPAPTITLSTFSTLPTPPPEPHAAIAPPASVQDWSAPEESAPVAPPQEPDPVAPPAAAPPPPRPVVDTPIAVHTPAPVVERPAHVATHTPVPAAATTLVGASAPSLAEAFAVLLSAEQGRRVAASAVGSAHVSEDTVEEIVRQVLARMSDQVVRDTVIDVAERLVRQEIERIKGAQ